MKKFLLISIIVAGIFSVNTSANAQTPTLKISRIVMTKTPQSGTWRAGVSFKLVLGKEDELLWHGGEQEFSGLDATLPVNFTVENIPIGYQIYLFIGLDDDAEDAGSTRAEDQVTLYFVPKKTMGSETFYRFDGITAGEKQWDIKVYYTYEVTRTIKKAVVKPR